MYQKLIDVFENSNQITFTKQQVIRMIKAESETDYVIGNIESNGVKLEVNGLKIVQGDKVDSVPLKVFKILHFLIKNKNICITREMILQNCWEKDICVGIRTIDVHVCKLKNILHNRDLVTTIKKSGYIWQEK